MFPSFPHWTLEDGFNGRVEWLLPRICFFPVQAPDCYSLVPFWALLESKQLGSEILKKGFKKAFLEEKRKKESPPFSFE